MRLLIQTPVASQNRITYPNKEQLEESNRKFPFFWIVFLLIITCVIFSKKPFLERSPDGKIQLAKWRKDKLRKALKELDEAEQYVLVAKRTGIYPCHSCPNSSTIYLETGQVWKYGFTTKSEKGRYQRALESQNLFYLVEYEGTITACLKEEKRKIYFYALLPENLKRETPLIRPPGNKQDN